MLAADPRDPKRLVAASMYSPPPADPAGSAVVVYASADGGATWRPTLEPKAPPRGVRRPGVRPRAGRRPYFVTMHAPSLGELPGKGGLELARSRDGGRTWDEAARVAAYHDRPFLAADRGTGKFRGRLYCSTHRGVLASADRGRSFGPLHALPRPEGSRGDNPGTASSFPTGAWSPSTRRT